MRILALLGAVIVAGLLQTTPSQAQGRWCIISDDRWDCSQPSFEVCHFSTFGEGGFCYPAPGQRWRPEPAPRAAALANVNVWYYPAPIPTGNWCIVSDDRWDCSQPSFEVCHFSTFGEGGFCYPRLRYARARAHRGTAFAQVRRHHTVPAERTVAIASAPTAVAAPNQVACAEAAAANSDAASGPVGCPALDEPAAAEAMASATPVAVRSTQPLVIPRGMPSFNVTPSCRAFASVMGAAGAQQELDRCLASESGARAQIAQQWNEFPAADRSGCAGLTSVGGGGTYTELLSCLEVRRDARNLGKDNPGVRLAVR